MRRIRTLSSLLLALATLSYAGTAQAQAPRGPPCAARSEVVGHLRDIYGEHLVGNGLAEGGYMLELFTGPAGSWTVFATTPEGMSCLISAGNSWEPLPRPDIFAGR
jgi:hypothetical protein